MIELGERLTRVASFVPNGSKVCDVGSDHAYLPVYLIQNDQISCAIAGEVVEGPFLSAKQTVRDYCMEDRIEVRLGDGLQILSKEDEITAVTICGMGGELISRILEAGYSGSHLNGRERLILQPNVAEHFVREWLMNHSYQIVEENHHFKKEGGHYYRNSLIYREKLDRITEQTLEKELVLKNHSKVMYDPDLIPKEMIKQ